MMIGHPSCFMDSVWCCRGEWLHCAVTQNTLSLHITWQGLRGSPRLCWVSVYVCVRHRRSVALTHPLKPFFVFVCDSMCVCVCACVCLCVCVWVSGETERVFVHTARLCAARLHYGLICHCWERQLWPADVTCSDCVCACVCECVKEREDKRGRE